MKLLEMPEFKASDRIADDVAAMAEMSKAIKSAFPVGHIILTFDSRNPNTYIGGTWKRIQGCFLWCAGSAPTGENFSNPHETGGSVAHRHLTHMGSDGLRVFAFHDAQGVPYYGSEQVPRGKGINVAMTSELNDDYIRIAYTAHERNMPPFTVCYAWERTA